LPVLVERVRRRGEATWTRGATNYGVGRGQRGCDRRASLQARAMSEEARSSSEGELRRSGDTITRKMTGRILGGRTRDRGQPARGTLPPHALARPKPGAASKTERSCARMRWHGSDRDHVREARRDCAARPNRVCARLPVLAAYRTIPLPLTSDPDRAEGPVSEAASGLGVHCVGPRLDYGSESRDDALPLARS
jgi:hypothetical protein